MMEKKLANYNLAMGLTRDALGIFSAWEMWDNILACYQLLDQDVLAEELVLARLAIEPSANMWCVLGDIKRDEAHFWKARCAFSTEIYTRGCHWIARLFA
jgi:hypothetical protein